MRKAYLIVVHGDRSGEAERSLIAMLETLRQRHPQEQIEGAVLMTMPEYLHLEHVAERMALEGIQKLVIVPWFLFAGPHVQKDIPEIVARVQARHPSIETTYAEPLAMDPLMVQLLESRM